MENQVVLFGACGEAALAIQALKADGKEILYFVDNSERKHGTKWLGIEVISFKDFLGMKDQYELIITILNPAYRKQIIAQIQAAGVTNWRLFHKSEWKEDFTKERIISYSQTVNLEDVILYHVCHDISNIFYIDIGANDPFVDSVTKTLYDTRNAHGINVEPQKRLFNRLQQERPRDINLCMGVGREQGSMSLFVQGGEQGGGSTLLQGKESTADAIETVQVVTLASICEQYLGKDCDITFLKIDVEGFERNVLVGADFRRWRPWIIVMEATKPGTLEWCYDEWEDILLENQYHFVYEYGIDRYYVANEHSELKERFIPMQDMISNYFVRKAQFDME